jgi:hypothetical protein
VLKPLEALAPWCIHGPLPSGVEEMLRFPGPVAHFRHTVVAGITGGVEHDDAV